MLSFFQFFTFRRQLILFGVALASIIPLHLWAGFAGSWLPVLVVLILLVKHLLIGTVNASAMAMQTGDFEEAENLLKYTFKPNWLQFTYHGMYYFVKSTLAFRKKNYKEAEQLSNKAMELDLQDDFKAMLYLQLMNNYGTRNNRVKVKELYDKARKLNVSQRRARKHPRSGTNAQGHPPSTKEDDGQKSPTLYDEPRVHAPQPQQKTLATVVFLTSLDQRFCLCSLPTYA